MPSVAEEHPRLTLPSRKRRRDNDVNDLQIQGPLYEKLANYSAAASTNWNADGGVFGRPLQQQLNQHQPSFFPQYPSNALIFQHGGPEGQYHTSTVDSAPRKMAPLPGAKRQRMFEDEDAEEDDTSLGASSITSPQRQRRGSKSPSSQPSRVLHDQTAVGARPKTPSLSPCHICHRRPTKKSDLDSFADCLGCGQRTCYVCIRQCHGWKKDGRRSEGEELEQEDSLSRSFHMDDIDDERQRQNDEQHDGGRPRRQDGWTGGGHRTMICSRCCIEKGTEGEAVCLGCLSRMESV